MKEHVRIHHFYTSPFIRIIRLSILVLLLLLLFSDVSASRLPQFPLFFLSLYMMWEVFFHFSLSRIGHGVPVSDNTTGDPYGSFSHVALDVFYASSSSDDLIKHIMHFPGVIFMLQRMSVTPGDVIVKQAAMDEIAKQAFMIASQQRRDRVTTMDLFAAYLLLTEKETSFLFNHELKENELSDIVLWASMFDTQEEEFPMMKPYRGDGFGELLVYGWTPETEKYTTDFTYRAMRSARGLIGRQTEYETVLRALSKETMRNVLLVGDAGIGKEKLLETLAQDSQNGVLTPSLNHKRIITLMVGPLLAGTGDRSELEVRLQTVIAELLHAGNIILAIPEIQEILGESSYNINLGGALLPYLKDGQLPVVATITPDNYKTYMEKNGLHEVFTTVTMREPDEATLKRILFISLIDQEKHMKVIVSYHALKRIILLSKRYLPDDVVPGSAMKLAEDAMQAATTQSLMGRKLVTAETVDQLVENKVNAPVSQPKPEEKHLLLHLEEKLHERVIGQDQAIRAIAEAIRRLRTGVSNHERPVSFLFLGPTGVGKTETAKALAELYYGGENRMLRLDMSEYSDQSSVARLLGAAPGSGSERGELTEKIHDNPYTLVLLDEFEKAHPSILDLFLQVLSDGRLTDNKGRTVSFREAIIIATSNAGSEFIREELRKDHTVDKAFHARLIEELESRHIFKPELLNRFDSVVTFRTLTKEQLKEVVTLQLDEVVKQMTEKDITIAIDDAVIEKILTEGFDEQFGARPLRRYIQDTIEQLLAKLTLEEKIKRGDTVRFTIGQTGEIEADTTP